LTCPRPPLGGFTTLMQQNKNPQGAPEGLRLPISNGASPVASALGIRLGATPCGHPHPNIHSRLRPSKQDISKWQAIGHFYLALTVLKVQVP
jgi:hypothetical protein